jgi:GH15 family glucan-1,4-alpha-glucosidase
MVVVIITSVSQQRPPIRSFSVLSRPCSLGQKIHLMLTCGSGWWNPSSHYLTETVQMWPRSVSPPSSSMGLHKHGGTISLLCSRLTTWLSGESSRQHSEVITNQQTSWTTSSMNFWHSFKEVVQCCSMPKLSMTCVTTQTIMLTPMRRRETGSGGASVLSSVTISTPLG